MGMYDDLLVKYPLPNAVGKPLFGWQTKDTPEQDFATYEIRENGELWLLLPDDNHVQCNMTGAVYFYTFGSGGEWWEYVALYDQGNLISLREHDTPNTRDALAKALGGEK